MNWFEGSGGIADGEVLCRGASLKGRHVAGIEVQVESMQEHVFHQVKTLSPPWPWKEAIKIKVPSIMAALIHLSHTRFTLAASFPSHSSLSYNLHCKNAETESQRGKGTFPRPFRKKE